MSIDREHLKVLVDNMDTSIDELFIMQNSKEYLDIFYEYKKNGGSRMNSLNLPRKMQSVIDSYSCIYEELAAIKILDDNVLMSFNVLQEKSYLYNGITV